MGEVTAWGFTLQTHVHRRASGCPLGEPSLASGRQELSLFHLLDGDWGRGTDGEAGAGQGNPDAQSILLPCRLASPPWRPSRTCCTDTLDAFYLARTAKALQAHWQLMKQYYLLRTRQVTGPRIWQSGGAMYECGGMHVPALSAL